MSDPQRDALRLTKDVRSQLLEQNDGFTTRTYYEDKNFNETRTYEIQDGELHIRSDSNTSWADSHQQSEHVADDAETHRYLYNNLDSLNQEGLVPRASRPKTKVTPVADMPASEAACDYGTDLGDGTDIGFDSDTGTEDVSNDESEADEDLNPALIIAIVVVALAVTAGVTVAGVKVWKKSAKPALERRRAARAEQRAADERAELEVTETPEDSRAPRTRAPRAEQT